tara:strand:- start:478 stop:750 length:273 start_codon:yes stop_codon:yes gene_type:complete
MDKVNIITIEKNVPIPAIVSSRGNAEKYVFIDGMNIGDSFKINGNTPDFTTVGVRAHVYGLNAKGMRKFTVRTLAGKSSNPTAIRVWMVG